MTHWTEKRIRERLDGTFTRVGHDGKIEVQSVPHDYKPGISTNGGRPVGYKGAHPQNLWTPAEDELLLQMKLRNRPFDEIAWLISRSEEATRRRYQVLRVKGAVMV